MSLPSPTDPSQPLRVGVGTRFRIILVANHTTGYSWQLMPPIPAIVRQEGTDYQTALHADGMVGVGGWEIWTFQALTPGRATLTFHYRRPFDPTAPPAEVATFHIHSR